MHIYICVYVYICTRACLCVWIYWHVVCIWRPAHTLPNSAMVYTFFLFCLHLPSIVNLYVCVRVRLFILTCVNTPFCILLQKNSFNSAFVRIISHIYVSFVYIYISYSALHFSFFIWRRFCITLFIYTGLFCSSLFTYMGLFCRSLFLHTLLHIFLLSLHIAAILLQQPFFLPQRFCLQICINKITSMFYALCKWNIEPTFENFWFGARPHNPHIPKNFSNITSQMHTLCKSNIESTFENCICTLAHPFPPCSDSFFFFFSLCAAIFATLSTSLMVSHVHLFCASCFQLCAMVTFCCLHMYIYM